MQVYGTNQFSGLNTQSAEHLLPPHVLCQADNVNYDEVGAVKSEKADLSPSGVAVANVDGIGVAERDGTKYYYKVTSAGSGTVYEYDGGTATDVGGSWGDGQLRVLQVDDAVVLCDGEDVMVYDGTILRDAGPLVGTGNSDPEDDYPFLAQPVSADVNIDDISVSSGVVTVTTTANHGLTTGDSVYISGVVGAVQVNSKVYTVTVTSATEFTLDDTNGSTWGSYTSGGTVYPGACGLDGNYFYWVSYELTLPGGDTIESSLEPIPGLISGDGPIEISPGAVCRLYVNGVQPSDITGHLSGTYTLGTDLTVAARIWRSKAGGATPYLVGEIAHADIYDPADGYATYDDTTSDRDLGAVWLERFDAHDSPPSYGVAAVHKSRVYAVDADNPTSLRWSAYGKADYWHPNDEIKLPEQIKAIGSVGDYLVALSETRCWLYTNDDGVGYLEEIRVPSGATSQEALVCRQGAAYFANDVGLWALSGRALERLSAPVDEDWRAAGGGAWAGAAVGDKMIFTCDTGGADKAFVLKATGDGLVWGRTDQDSDGDYELFAPDPKRRRFFCQRADGIYFFGEGEADKEMTIRLREFGDGRLATLVGFVLEGSSDLDGEVNILGNHEDLPSVMHVEGNGRGRTVVRQKCPRLQGEYWKVSFTGTGTVYGLWLEVEPCDGRNP